jgi:hypothetical protein
VRPYAAGRVHLDTGGTQLRPIRVLVAAVTLCAVAGTLVAASCARPAKAPPATFTAGAEAASAAPHASPPSGPLPGFLLIADRGNDRLLLVDGRKRVLWVYPRPGSTPSFPFRYDDDAFFCPGYRAIISSQEDQHTIQIVSFPKGVVLWHYGHPDQAGSAPGYLDRPDDAYLLPGGTRTVADILNDRVLFISPRGRIVRQYGTTGAAGHRPPILLGSPNGDTPTPDGGTLITEIGGSWLDAISARGKLVWSVHTPASYPSDAQPLANGTYLLADYVAPGRLFIIDRGGTTLWSYGPSTGAGALDHPSLALPLPNGLIAVNDDYRHRVVLIDPARRRIVWQFGHTDVPGSAPGFLDTPDGLDFLPYEVVARNPALRPLLTAPPAP